MKKFVTTVALFAALGTAPVFAGHPYANGEEASGGVAKQAVENGTLHPGHVAVGASGKYNEPAADYHLDGTKYESGAGGYAKTKRNENAN